MVDGEGLDREAMQQHVAMQALNRLINILT